MTQGHCHDRAGPSIHSFEGRRGADPVRDYHYGLGAACRALGRHDEAADALRRAVGLEPGRADGHRDLGVAAMPLGRHDEAIAHLRRALRLRPDDLGSGLIEENS